MMKRVLSLGAGVQSSTLALMAAHGDIDMPDCAIFADTQSEPQAVYRWLDWLEKQLPFPVYRVTKGNLFDAATKLHVSKNGNGYTKATPPAWITEDGGKTVNLMMRQCTVYYKIQPIIKKMRDLGFKKGGVEQLIGISKDEAQRMKPARDRWITNRWPLIEKFMTREDCFTWMREKGYPVPPRSSCSFCPYHSNDEWKRLKNNDPQAFSEAIRFERALQNAMGEVKSFRGKAFLHRSCRPLDEIDFNAKSPQLELDFFGNECEGMCGV